MMIRVLITVGYLLFSVALGLWFLLYDGHYTFGQLKHFRGFWLSWASSAGITFLAMCGVDYLTRMLHKRWPWGRTWPKRLGLQLSLGLLLPMAVVLAWNAHFFYSQHQLANLEQYFDSEYELAGIFLVLFNALCCCVLLAWDWLQRRLERDNTSEDAADDTPGEETVPQTAEERTAADHAALEKAGIDVEQLKIHTAYIEVSSRVCTVYHMDGGKNWYTVPIDLLERCLQGPDFCRIHRNNIVRRGAIAGVDMNKRAHACTVSLKAPYEKVRLQAGRKYLKAFQKWWADHQT